MVVQAVVITVDWRFAGVGIFCQSRPRSECLAIAFRRSAKQRKQASFRGRVNAALAWKAGVSPASVVQAGVIFAKVAPVANAWKAGVSPASPPPQKLAEDITNA